MKKRTTKETAKAVEITVKSIQKVLDAAIIMQGYDFFDGSIFREKGKDKVIRDLCKRNKVSEEHIRDIGGWNNKDVE